MGTLLLSKAQIKCFYWFVSNTNTLEIKKMQGFYIIVNEFDASDKTKQYLKRVAEAGGLKIFEHTKINDILLNCSVDAVGVNMKHVQLFIDEVNETKRITAKQIVAYNVCHHAQHFGAKEIVEIFRVDVLENTADIVRHIEKYDSIEVGYFYDPEYDMFDTA